MFSNVADTRRPPGAGISLNTPLSSPSGDNNVPLRVDSLAKVPELIMTKMKVK